jgi:hypothetical protein
MRFIPASRRNRALSVPYESASKVGTLSASPVGEVVRRVLTTAEVGVVASTPGAVASARIPLEVSDLFRSYDRKKAPACIDLLDRCRTQRFEENFELFLGPEIDTALPCVKGAICHRDEDRAIVRAGSR